MLNSRATVRASISPLAQGEMQSEKMKERETTRPPTNLLVVDAHKHASQNELLRVQRKGELGTKVRVALAL